MDVNGQHAAQTLRYLHPCRTTLPSAMIPLHVTFTSNESLMACDVTSLGIMSWLWRRSPDTQLALLDRLAGTDAAVAQYTEKLEQLRTAHAQLAAIDALGSQEQRERLQALVDQARPTLCLFGILVLHPQP